MIATKGFRDVIEVGRRTRPQPYGMFGKFEPIIPRELRLEVTERVDAAGRIVTPLVEEELHDAAASLQAMGCESVVVHFLHAYANPVHEARAAEILREIWPNDYVTAGHELYLSTANTKTGDRLSTGRTPDPSSIYRPTAKRTQRWGSRDPRHER